MKELPHFIFSFLAKDEKISKRESFCKSNVLDLKSIKIKAVTDRTILKILKNVLKL
jgi:hypothetical protein